MKSLPKLKNISAQLQKYKHKKKQTQNIVNEDPNLN